MKYMDITTLTVATLTVLMIVSSMVVMIFMTVNENPYAPGPNKDWADILKIMEY